MMMKHEIMPSEGVSYSERRIGTAVTSETAETCTSGSHDSVEMIIFQKPLR